MFANSAENISQNKEATTNTSEEVEKYFSGFLAFIDSTTEQ